MFTSSSSSRRSLTVVLASVALAGALVLAPTKAWADDASTKSKPSPAASSSSTSTPSTNDGKTSAESDTTNDDSSSSKLITHNGGYGAPQLKLTGIAGSVGLLMGSQGGWIINHHFVLGGAGYGLVNDVSVEQNGSKASIGFGYGGVRPGVILGSPSSVIHFTSGVLLAGAGVSAKAANDTTTTSNNESGSVTWVVEPDAGVEATITKWLRVSIDGSYRVVGGAQEANLRAAQLSGPAASLAFKFGSF